MMTAGPYAIVSRGMKVATSERVISLSARFRLVPFLATGLCLLAGSACDTHLNAGEVGALDGGTTPYVPRTRTYYVAAEDTLWDYAPLGKDPVFDRPLAEPWGKRTRYPKQRYVGYTDSTFTTPLPAPAWQGILGPRLRGVVGDTLRVVFHNRAGIPLSMHPHGVRYRPPDEGALYNPPRGGGDAVQPGGSYTYTWYVMPESGPTAGEPGSKVWLYHSHVTPDVDIYRGLIGTIVIADPTRARSDGTPTDVDREFTTLWMVFNENTPSTPPALEEGNLEHAINGYVSGNLTGLSMHSGERVRWYVVSLGTEVDLHTPHWHGQTLTLEGRTTLDVVELLPASAKVADMVADNPGTWLLHCHVSDHMMAGMYTTFAIDSTTTEVRSAP